VITDFVYKYYACACVKRFAIVPSICTYKFNI